MNLSIGLVSLFLTFTSLIPALGFLVVTFGIGAAFRDLFVGLVWGIAFDILTVLWLRATLPLAIRHD